MGYNLKYKGTKIDELLDKAGTALQEHQDISHLATKTEVDKKVDKVNGKQLSTEDFTTALKNKLNGLSNYDDTAVNNAINGLQSQINTLVSGDANTAIESFNEIIAFLDGVTDTQTLEGIIASIERQIAAKQDIITDLATIRSGAAKGATALQSHQDISGKLDKTEAASTYVPRSGGPLNDGASLTFSLYGTRTLKVTGNSIDVDMSKDTGGWAGTFASIKDPLKDVTTMLGWYGGTGGLTHIFMGGSYNAPAMKMEKNGQFTFKYSPKVGNKTIATVEDLATVATSGSYNDLSNKPTIPSAVTESTVSGWGFTKNTGTITEIKMNGALIGTSGVVDLGTVITAHQDISGKQDKALKFTNLSASSWVDDTTYSDYPYRCDLICSGVVADYYAEVVFGVTEATSGDYAPICETKTDAISLWSKKNDSIVIPTIIITKL